MQAGAKLQEEILAGPSFEEASERALGRRGAHPGRAEKSLPAGGRRGLEKYRERLADQQEIVAALSDVVIEFYAIESSLRRVQKAASGARRGFRGA